MALAVQHALLSQGLPVPFICRIEGVEAPLHLLVPSDGRVSQRVQRRLPPPSVPVHSRSGEHPVAKLDRVEVLLPYPVYPLVRMSPFRPSPDRPVYQVIHAAERLFGHYGAVIVRPTP